MATFFEFTKFIKYLLFENVQISSVSGLVIACLLISLLSGLYEVVHFLRQYLIYKTKQRCKTPATESSQLCGTAQPVTTTIKIQIHCSQSLLHVLQVTIGYIIMLCVMTFNASIFLCVIFSMGLAYFLLGSVLSRYTDLTEDVCAPNPEITNEHRSYSSISKEEAIRTE